MNGLRAGWTAYNGGGAYNPAALTPNDPAAWESLAARRFRYAHYEHYYHNTVYSSLASGAAGHRTREKLYKHIRAIYNPVARQNDLLVSLVYGGGIDLEHLTGGAIPLVYDNRALTDALRHVFVASRFGELKSLYVRLGALYGDVALKVIDEPAREKVRLEVLHPQSIRAVTLDAVGNVKAIAIEYADRDADGRPYIYSELIDGARFQTFKDGQPFAYQTDLDGRPVSAWDNPYGFVPVALAGHKATGARWAMNAFAHALRKIDEINDLASLINDQTRKSVNTLWYFAGVRAPSELNAATDDRDALPAVYGPADSHPHAMIADAPIGDALSALREMLQELERDMPELALQRIREQGGTFSAPGVRAAFSDAVGRIQEVRGNYDHALVRALQMAVSIGGLRGYAGFGAFGLDSYARGDIDVVVKDRAVIGDSLSVTERLSALARLSEQPPAIQRLMLRELDYSEREIAAVVADGAPSETGI
ncbi:MAG: hypothetical protein SGI73_18415 [Chloroflexota bacterium]|nr:hypothetical protein [Chloroflexota bacterium]